MLADGPDRDLGRQGPGAAPRGGGLRPDPARERARRSTSPTRRWPSRRSPRRPASAGSSPTSDRRPTTTTEVQPDWSDARGRPRSIRSRSGRTSRSSTRRCYGHRLVYLDSAATSQKPLAVIEAMDAYYRQYNANVHRGIYQLGERATAAYEGARAKVARLIGAPDAREIVWTRNATEAINLVAYSWGRRNIGRGDVIVLTEMEHHANLVPWQILAQEKDADLEFIPITDDGVLRQDVFEVLLRLQAEAGRVHPRVEHAGHDQPGRGDDPPGPRGRRARAGRRGAGGAAPAGRRRRRSAATSTCSAATRRWRPPAPACCGAVASCSRRCRRSWAAAT